MKDILVKTKFYQSSQTYKIFEMIESLSQNNIVIYICATTSGLLLNNINEFTKKDNICVVFENNIYRIKDAIASIAVEILKIQDNISIIVDNILCINEESKCMRNNIIKVYDELENCIIDNTENINFKKVNLEIISHIMDYNNTPYYYNISYIKSNYITIEEKEIKTKKSSSIIRIAKLDNSISMLNKILKKGR